MPNQAIHKLDIFPSLGPSLDCVGSTYLDLLFEKRITSTEKSAKLRVHANQA